MLEFPGLIVRQESTDTNCVIKTDSCNRKEVYLLFFCYSLVTKREVKVYMPWLYGYPRNCLMNKLLFIIAICIPCLACPNWPQELVSQLHGYSRNCWINVLLILIAICIPCLGPKNVFGPSPSDSKNLCPSFKVIQNTVW